MTVREAKETEREWWNNCVWHSPASYKFLGSWEWGELEREEGRKIWRLSNGEKVVLVIKRVLPLGHSWLYVQGELDEALEEKLKEMAKQEKAIFIRREGVRSKWQKAKQEVQPRKTLVLDLTKSEEELLQAMHQKTRYNIRLAEKKGVQVRFSQAEQDLAKFLELVREVEGRGEFKFHPAEHYRVLLKILGPAGQLSLLVAEHEGEVLAVNMLIKFAETATYLHGVSSNSKRMLMAPALAQWEGIRWAKAQGMKEYDFWGIGPQWPGVTRFKSGFGGERREYDGAYDLVIDRWWYLLYNWRKR
jgi:peptidoglycan pentaglycine glycine transferase (the first glycine)